MPNRLQTIIWTNADSIHWRIGSTLGGDELTLPGLGTLTDADRSSIRSNLKIISVHDDAIKLKPFPHHWTFVMGIHRSLVDSPHKGQWREVWCVLWSAPEQMVWQTVETPAIWDAIKLIMMPQLWSIVFFAEQRWHLHNVNVIETIHFVL